MLELAHANALDHLAKMDVDSIDSLITDPPAGISFMGKDWDHHKGGRDAWIAWLKGVMQECFRVMKPGAHGLVWALPRTSHWTATALENAGFEIRDVVTHLFGSGFPKSLNIGKTVKEFEGWGTALKPASEHWVLVRKPLSEKTVAKNVLKYGTGGLNIDGSRISTGGEIVWKVPTSDKISSSLMVYDKPGAGSDSMFKNKGGREGMAQGRFPANLVLDEEAAEMLDEQSGQLSQCGGPKKTTHDAGMFGIGTPGTVYYENSRGASRFFYVAKASKSDKGSDNTHPTVKSTKLMEYLIKLITPPGGTVLDPFMGSGSTGVAAKRLEFGFIGIEKEAEYMKIAKERLVFLEESAT